MNIYEGVDVGGPAFFRNSVYANAPVEMQSAPINGAQSSDVASAATINLDTATGNLVDVTGTTTITAITLSQGRERVVRFTGALTLTNGASLVLPGGANITTAAGDFAIFRGYASGVVRCVVYSKASGFAVVAVSAASQSDQETATSTTTYASPGTQQYHPSAAKVWCQAGVTGNILVSYNMTSVTDTGTGDITFTIATDFSSANFVGMLQADATGSTTDRELYLTNPAVGSMRGFRTNSGGTAVDPTSWYFAAWGDQ